MLFRFGQKILDNYTIGDIYSNDARFDKVRRATHKKTGIERAINQKPKSDYPNRDAFVKKMEYVASFDHPNICKLLEVYEDDTNYYVVTEVINGGDIIDNIYNSGQFTETYASNIIR